MLQHDEVASDGTHGRSKQGAGWRDSRAVEREKREKADKWFTICKHRPIFVLSLRIKLLNFWWLRLQRYESTMRWGGMKRRVEQMSKVEPHGWMGARLGEGWKRKLRRHYGYVRGNKWGEEEEERTMIKLRGRYMKDGQITVIEKWEKTECVCHRWGLTLLTLLSVCVGPIISYNRH